MPRIVSLISSATEIVDALGMTSHLVGRSHECDYPEAVKALPMCTSPRIPIAADSAEIDRLVRESKRSSISIYDVFAEVIEALEPTHILTQIQCDVCAVSLRDVAHGLEGRAKERCAELDCATRRSARRRRGTVELMTDQDSDDGPDPVVSHEGAENGADQLAVPRHRFLDPPSGALQHRTSTDVTSW